MKVIRETRPSVLNLISTFLLRMNYIFFICEKKIENIADWQYLRVLNNVYFISLNKLPTHIEYQIMITDYLCKPFSKVGILYT